MIAAHCVGSSPARSRTSRIALAFVLASYLLPGIVSSSFPQKELRTKPGSVQDGWRSRLVLAGALTNTIFIARSRAHRGCFLAS